MINMLTLWLLVACESRNHLDRKRYQESELASSAPKSIRLTSVAVGQGTVVCGPTVAGVSLMVFCTVASSLGCLIECGAELNTLDCERLQNSRAYYSDEQKKCDIIKVIS